jgi:hypothetical protein
MSTLDIFKLADPQARRGAVIKTAEAQIDEQHYEYLAQFKWHLVNKYPCRSIRVRGSSPKARYLHQDIILLNGLELPQHPLTIDHKNRDTLDSRFENLRIVTREVQNRNRSRFSINISGYSGVSFMKKAANHKRPWKATTHYQGKNIYIGFYDNPVDAARAVNSWWREHYPEVSIPNPSVGFSDQIALAEDSLVLG